MLPNRHLRVAANSQVVKKITFPVHLPMVGMCNPHHFFDSQAATFGFRNLPDEYGDFKSHFSTKMTTF
jgi:hypothetical protein